MIAVLAVSAVFPQLCFAQTEQQLSTPPSSAEILELANKADEKVVDFEAVLKKAAPYLDKHTLQTDEDAVNTTHSIIESIRKKGADAYVLVSLLSTLDDLSLDASRASLSVLLYYTQNASKGDASNTTALASVMDLSDSDKSLSDISDLLLHATLRYVAAEENTLIQLLEKPKK
ncbi:MAG: hypothetical protein ABSC47_07840 [Terracidiphilus sp.]|jgi:hypothetical protein